MKIIKRGSPPAEEIWRGQCRVCHTVAEATRAELKHVQNDVREGTQFSWEECPVCGTGSHMCGYGGMLFYPKKGYDK